MGFDSTRGRHDGWQWSRAAGRGATTRRDKLRSGCAEVCLTRHDNGTTAGGPGRLARDATTRGTTTARRRAVATTRATRRHDDGTTAGSGLGRLARGYRASGAATAQRLSSHPVRGSSSQCSSQSANSHRAASRKLRSGCAEVLSRRASDQLPAEQSFPPSSARVPSKRRRNCPNASHRIRFVALRAKSRPNLQTRSVTAPRWRRLPIAPGSTQSLSHRAAAAQPPLGSAQDSRFHREHLAHPPRRLAHPPRSLRCRYRAGAAKLHISLRQLCSLLSLLLSVHLSVIGRARIPSAALQVIIRAPSHATTSHEMNEILGSMQRHT